MQCSESDASFYLYGRIVPGLARTLLELCVDDFVAFRSPEGASCVMGAILIQFVGAMGMLTWLTGS
jgi:hypothetical protein